MDDLISRQAAIEAILAVTGNSSVRELYEHVQEHGLSDMWTGGVNAAIDIIIALPPAQPEIIRCKDCKHIVEHKCYGNLGESAFTCEGNMDGWVLPDFYCGRAERRTDD